MGADDIAQIMNEIEELQQEMNASLEQKPQLVAVSTPPASAQPAVPQSEPTPAASEDAATDTTNLHLVPPPAEPEETATSEASENPVPVEEDSILKEFSAGAAAEGEPSLEASMAELKDDSVSTGRSLLDDPVEQEVTKSEESDTEVSETTSEELSEEEKAVEKEVEQLMQDSQLSSSDDLDEISELTMSVKGKMGFRFEYNDRKESLTLKFSSGELLIVLANGSEFKIPIRPKAE
jgi:hypothetical protein